MDLIFSNFQLVIFLYSSRICQSIRIKTLSQVTYYQLGHQPLWFRHVHTFRLLIIKSKNCWWKVCSNVNHWLPVTFSLHCSACTLLWMSIADHRYKPCIKEKQHSNQSNNHKYHCYYHSSNKTSFLWWCVFLSVVVFVTSYNNNNDMNVKVSFSFWNEEIISIQRFWSKQWKDHLCLFEQNSPRPLPLKSNTTALLLKSLQFLTLVVEYIEDLWPPLSFVGIPVAVSVVNILSMMS